MYQDFDFRDLQRETQEKLAKIYKESFDEQEFVDTEKIDETYGKIRKILDCPEMEKCHPFLYALDMEHVNEKDNEKINKLYDLGVSRGLIREDDDDDDSEDDAQSDTDADAQSDVENDCGDSNICGGPADALTDQKMTPQPTQQIPLGPTPMDVPEVQPKPIYTVLYSGMKEGDLKVGEFYSMAGSTDGSKEDCVMNLTAKGYSDIMIMAVEQTTPQYNTALPDVGQEPSDVGVDDVYGEDDSEEYLRQETGDTENTTTDDNEVQQDKKVIDSSNDDDGNGQSDSVENSEDDLETSDDASEENTEKTDGDDSVENTDSEEKKDTTDENPDKDTSDDEEEEKKSEEDK